MIGSLGSCLEELRLRGFRHAEVYVKEGRSRRLGRNLAEESAASVQERGWAVRAGNDRGSFFATGTGEPPPAGPWPEPGGPPLVLPEPVPADPWAPPRDLDVPLIGEREGLALLATLERALDTELPGARLLSARLDDGASEASLESSAGLTARSRNRIALLRAEAVGRGQGAVALAAAGRDARRLEPRALARRLADLLLVSQGRPLPASGPTEVLLAPAVAQRVIQSLLPLLVGGRAWHRMAPLADGQGRVGTTTWTVVDDGRRGDGLLSAAADGEGLPTGTVTLVEEGVYRQPLLNWWEAREHPGRPTGCTRRASFRDLPTPGPTHLFLRPSPGVSVASLLGSIGRGYYFLDTPGAPRFDFDANRFALPVVGFAVERGRAMAAVAAVELGGSIGQLLHGLAGVARDLTFAPLDGMIGAPSMLLTGLEVQAVAPS